MTMVDLDYKSPSPPPTPQASRLPPFLQWSWQGRLIVFLLSASSIWCLLADFYHLCDMQTFTAWVLIPATIALIGMAIIDRQRGNQKLWRAVAIGAVGGLLAAFSYDLF